MNFVNFNSRFWNNCYQVLILRICFPGVNILFCFDVLLWSPKLILSKPSLDVVTTRAGRFWSWRRASVVSIKINASNPHYDFNIIMTYILKPVRFGAKTVGYVLTTHRKNRCNSVHSEHKFTALKYKFCAATSCYGWSHINEVAYGSNVYK